MRFCWWQDLGVFWLFLLWFVSLRCNWLFVLWCLFLTLLKDAKENVKEKEESTERPGQTECKVSLLLLLNSFYLSVYWWTCISCLIFFFVNGFTGMSSYLHVPCWFLSLSVFLFVILIEFHLLEVICDFDFLADQKKMWLVGSWLASYS